MKNKWCPAVCPSCGGSLPPVLTDPDEPEPWVSAYPCWDCEHPEAAEAERLKWETSDRLIMEATCRGEILDAQGNPGEPIVVTQHGGGRYTIRRYTLDLFGLHETTQEARHSS